MTTSGRLGACERPGRRSLVKETGWLFSFVKYFGVFFFFFYQKDGEQDPGRREMDDG